MAGDSSLEANREEGHDNPHCLISAIVISIKTLGDFFERDVARTGDYYFTLGTELG